MWTWATGAWRSASDASTHPSIVLHTAPAIDYEFTEHGNTTTQTTFFNLPIRQDISCPFILRARNAMFLGRICRFCHQRYKQSQETTTCMLRLTGDSLQRPEESLKYTSNCMMTAGYVSDTTHWKRRALPDFVLVRESRIWKNLLSHWWSVSISVAECKPQHIQEKQCHCSTGQHFTCFDGHTM